MTDADRREIAEIAQRIHDRDAVERNGAPPPASAAPGTMAGVLLTHLRAAYDPLYRREQLVWSRPLARAVDLREAGAGPATPLLARLLGASDCPRDREGAPSAAGVLRVWRQHLGVAWADMLAALPDEAATAEVDGAAGDELRRQLAALLGRIVSIGRRVVDGRDADVQARSLLGCCLAWAAPGRWERVRDYWLWCRLDGDEPLPTGDTTAEARAALQAERRRRLRVALRVELAGQVGVRPLADWPARRLTELCEHYGIGRRVRVGRTRRHLVELTQEYLADLLGEPETDRTPGEEG